MPGWDLEGTKNDFVHNNVTCNVDKITVLCLCTDINGKPMAAWNVPNLKTWCALVWYALENGCQEC